MQPLKEATHVMGETINWEVIPTFANNHLNLSILVS